MRRQSQHTITRSSSACLKRLDDYMWEIIPRIEGGANEPMNGRILFAGAQRTTGDLKSGLKWSILDAAHVPVLADRDFCAHQNADMSGRAGIAPDSKPNPIISAFY